MRKYIFIIPVLLIYTVAVGQKKISIEFSASGVNSSIVVPKLMTPPFKEVESGGGNEFALGISSAINDKLSIRGGLKTWQWAFSHRVIGEMNGQSIEAVEVGHLRYSGIYARLDRTWNGFFLTGGLDISFANKYKNTLTVFNNSDFVIDNQQDRKESVLTDEFNNQVNLVLGMGPSIKIGKSFKVKGTVAMIVPFSPLYDTGVTASQIQINPNGSTSSAPDADINLDFFPVFKYGISIEYAFGAKE